MTFDFSEIGPTISQYFAGNPTNGIETMHTRSDNRGGLLRLSLARGGSVVVKVWRNSSPKERIKAALHLSNGRREWRAHRMIHRAGINSPEPLFFQCITVPGSVLYETMTIEDVGETERGVPYLKRLVKTNQYNEINFFEEQVIEITTNLINLKIVDVDNQLNNFLIVKSGNVVRTDFECACKYRFSALPQIYYAIMLDRLFRSHLHAVYPQSQRTTQFMSHMATRVSIPITIRKLVTEISINELKREKKETGIEYAKRLDWQ